MKRSNRPVVVMTPAQATSLLRMAQRGTGGPIDPGEAEVIAALVALLAHTDDNIEERHGR